MDIKAVAHYQAHGTDTRLIRAFTKKIWAVQKKLHLVPLPVVEPILKLLEKEIDNVTRPEVKVKIDFRKYRRAMRDIVAYLRKRYQGDDRESYSWLVLNTLYLILAQLS